LLGIGDGELMSVGGSGVQVRSLSAQGAPPELPDTLAIAAVFAEVFELESVGLDDNFFELGGDSLLAEATMVAIEKRFGVVLSMSALLEAPTPRALAEKVLAKKGQRSARWLIAVNPDGVPPPIFVIHGTIGDSIAPSRLSAAMPERALYAIRAIGMEPGEKLLRTSQDFAAAYLRGIRRVCPLASPILMGHCAGAIFAYEMAQQMLAAGKPAAGLILVDPEIAEDIAPFLHNSGLALTLMHKAWRVRASQLDDAIRQNPHPSGPMRRKIVGGGMKHAIGTYAPQPYDGPTLLICSPERRDILLDPKRGFPTLTSDLDVAVVPMVHNELFKTGLAESVDAIERFIARLGLAE
jgi:acyl carrier protein